VDQATIQQAQAGNRLAQDTLLRELQDPWYRLCLSLLGGDGERASDATQETALRVLRQIAEFRGESQLRTWTFGIAVNVCRELRRQKPLGGLEADQIVHSSDLPQDAAAQRSEESAALQQALTGLPQRQREAIVLRFFEELSVEQTAQAMQCAAGTVKATVHQALRSLREKLSELV